MSQASVLIISDDIEFARSVAARWQSERVVPDITISSTEDWLAATPFASDLVIVGPVGPNHRASLLESLSLETSSAMICTTADSRESSLVSSRHPHAIVLPRQDNWLSSLILLATEVLRRTSDRSRAQRAERQAIESQGLASLGRYMIDVRPSVNNALTSVLGNADLLLDSSELSDQSRDQILAVHAMALRLHEIMQRFSSLASELRCSEKDSQAETDCGDERLVPSV